MLVFYCFIALFAAGIAYAVLAPRLAGPQGGFTKAEIQRAQSEGRYRVVNIGGREFHAVRKSEIIVRTIAGRGRAVLVQTGRERDPHMVAGKVEMSPRWIKIRSFTRQGLSTNARWVSSSKWLIDGREDVEYHAPKAPGQRSGQSNN